MASSKQTPDQPTSIEFGGLLTEDIAKMRDKYLEKISSRKEIYTILSLEGFKQSMDVHHEIPNTVCDVVTSGEYIKKINKELDKLAASKRSIEEDIGIICGEMAAMGVVALLAEDPRYSVALFIFVMGYIFYKYEFIIKKENKEIEKFIEIISDKIDEWKRCIQ